MLIANLIPGASYSAGTFTIPLASLATSSGLTITAADSVERLLYGILQTMAVKANAGTLTQINAGCEVSSRSATTSVWETSANTFTQKALVSFLVSIAFDAAGSTEAANSVTILTG